MDSKYFGLKMSNESSSGSSRRGRKKSNSNTNNSPDKPKPPQRGLGVAQLERLRLQDQLISNYLNHCVPLRNDNSFDKLLQIPNQGNQWSSQTANPLVPFLPSLSYSSSSTSRPSEYQPNKMMKFGELERANTSYGNNLHPGATSKSNPCDRISNVVTWPLQNQQGEKNCTQKNRNADWLTLSIGSTSRKSETSEAREVDLQLKL